MDYAEESCALRREFGGPENRVVLQIQQFVPDSPMFSIQVVGPNLRWNNTAPDRLHLRYLPDEAPTMLGVVLRITAGELGHGVAFHAPLNFPFFAPTADTGAVPVSQEQRNAMAARAQQITGIELRDAFTQDMTLNTRSMGAPMHGLQACLGELLTHWGIDVAAHQTLQRKAFPVDQEEWARALQRAYPRSVAGLNADITVRLDISADGQVAACHMQQRLGDEAFGATACTQLIRHARFSPAIDAQGNPIASYYIQRIMYRCC